VLQKHLFSIQDAYPAIKFICQLRVKAGGLWWAGHKVRVWDVRKTCNILEGKPLRKQLLWKAGQRQDKFKEIQFDNMNWLESRSRDTFWCWTSEFWNGRIKLIEEDAVNFCCRRGLTPWSRIHLKKLIISQLVKKIPSFYRTRIFVTVPRRARHCSIFWVIRIQFTPYQTLFLRSFLILSPTYAYFFQVVPSLQISRP